MAIRTKRTITNSLIGPLLVALFFSACQNQDENHPDPFQEQNKLTFEVPSDVDADLYRITVAPVVGDTVTYFEYARARQVEIAVPAAGQSMVSVNAFKNNTLVFTGTSLVDSGDQALKKLTAQPTTVPATPEVPVLTIAGSAVAISWIKPAGAELVTIYRLLGNADSPTLLGSSQGTTLIDSSVPTGIEILYQISARNAAGESEPSTWASITVPLKTDLPQIPAVPQEVKAALSGPASVTISWNRVSGATFYSVYRSADGSAAAQKIATIATISLIDTALLPGSVWGYSVSAINDAGESARSLPVTISIPGIKPAAPAGVVANAVSESGIRVTWTAVATAESYLIQWGTTATGPFTSGSANSAEYVITGLSASTLYYIKVIAVNKTGQSSPSEAVSAKTSEPPLKPPAAPVLTATALSDTSIQLSWLQVSGADTYIIEQGSSSTGPFAVICTTASLSRTVSGLAPAATRYFRAVASNTAGKSAYSVVVSATTAARLAPPTALKKDTATAVSITISWQSAAGATSYKVYRSSTAGGTYASVGTATQTKYIDNGLTAATTYYYKVSSVNASAESVQSTELAVTTASATLPAPANLKATATASTSISITFSTVTGATGYKLYWSTSAAGSFTAISLTAASYTHTGRTAGTTYYYKVSAMKQTVESPQSETVSATTLTASAKVATISSACNGCSRCVPACKPGAIKRSGMVYIIDVALCDGDGACINACPRRAISLKNR